ncbi:MAG: AraC family transcriptional regulator [Lachnospiraceae bacterium]|nr:AraC family transcriptional regulator [Lachnospiraceae bacterium]
MVYHPETIAIHNIVEIDTGEQKDWAFPLHTHDMQLEISFILSGCGVCYFDGRTYPMHPGDIVIKNAGQIHAEKAEPDRPLRQICISFSGVSEIRDRPNCLLPGDSKPVFQSGEDEGILSEIFSYLALHWQDEEKIHACNYLQSALLDIITGIVERQSVIKKARKQDLRNDNTINNVTEWLNGNYWQKITLSRLSEMFFISPYYLDRKFKEHTGYSVNQYIIDLRMGEAQRLLIFETISIKEVALRVGYENLQYFYATFKKYTGDTPLVFRERFQGKTESL